MAKLEEFRIPTKIKLAGLWTSTMFCYAYGDYFGLYIPGAVERMNRGILGPLGPATPEVLVRVSVMMAAPSLMVCLSLILPTPICRWVNLAMGLLYTVIMALTLSSAPAFYLVFAVIEMSLTLAIAAMALCWPRTSNDA